MDSAVQVVNMASPVEVTAQEVNARFRGDVPKSIRFYCPLCARPVIACAMGQHFDRMRRAVKPGQRKTKDPYFAHRKNDEWSRYCDAYHANTGVSREERTLPLLMFLRREFPDRDSANREPGDEQHFRVEIALRRRGLSAMLHELSPNDAITVDDKSYSLRDMLSDRRRTIALPDPLRQTSSRIQVPPRWQINVGCAPTNTGILIFSDSFGSNGGRLLPDRSALHTDCMYYIVANAFHMSDAYHVFNQVNHIGTITGSRNLNVYTVYVASSSLMKNEIDDWLAQYGYCLSDIDRAAQLMWPPSIRSAGVDEPLFRASSPTYRFPYQIGNQRMAADIVSNNPLPDNPNARHIGLIGFGRKPDMEYIVESYCVFFKPKPRMPWNTAYLGPRYPDDLHPYDEWSQTNAADTVADNTASEDNSDNDAVQIPLSRSAEIALRRMKLHQSRSGSRGIAIAQSRERTHS